MKGQTAGYLSVFMSLTLTLVLSICLVFIEGARQNTIRLEAECIVDMGLNSVMAEYHREVLEQYNLFYIDCSYGTETASYYNTEANLRKYLEKNVTLQEEVGILAGNAFFPGVYMDLLELKFPYVRITGISLAADYAGYHFQKQAAQAVESDIGIGVIDKVMDWIRVVEAQDLLTNKVEEEIEAIEQELSELQGKKQLEDSTWITISAQNPVEWITGERQKGLLHWVTANLAGISDKTVDLQQYISSRRQKQQINQGNMGNAGKLTLYERLLFQEYLFRYAGDYLDIKKDAGLDYQIEYLLFGEASDMDNLRKTAAAICGLRETANMISLLNSAEKRELITAVSTLLGAALFLPEAVPVFEGIIMIAWSCLESLLDTRTLLNGGCVPLMKDDASWQTSIENVLDSSGGDGNESSSQGLNYEDYLRIFLYFGNLETVTYRFMDLMEMDIRLTEGNECFRMDGCIDYLEIAVTAESGYGYTYELKHAKGFR